MLDDRVPYAGLWMQSVSVRLRARGSRGTSWLAKTRCRAVRNRSVACESSVAGIGTSASKRCEVAMRGQVGSLRFRLVSKWSPFDSFVVENALPSFVTT